MWFNVKFTFINFSRYFLEIMFLLKKAYYINCIQCSLQFIVISCRGLLRNVENLMSCCKRWFVYISLCCLILHQLHNWLQWFVTKLQLSIFLCLVLIESSCLESVPFGGLKNPYSGLYPIWAFTFPTLNLWTYILFSQTAGYILF